MQKKSSTFALIEKVPKFFLFFIIIFMFCWHILESGGFPYFKDNNESYLSYQHAKNMIQYSPVKYGFLTAVDTSTFTHKVDQHDGLTIPQDIYTHNPNLPRYVNYILFLLGIEDFLTQYLLIIIIASCLSALVFYKSIKIIAPVSLVPLLALIIVDYQEVVPNLFNSYRIWSFFTFFYCFYAVVSNKKTHIFVSYFVLYQLEYGFALFTTFATFLFVLFDGMFEKKKIIIWAAAGIVCSLSLFLLQIIYYSGIDKLIKEFFVVYDARITALTGTSRWHFKKMIFTEIRSRYGYLLYSIIKYGIIRSIIPYCISTKFIPKASSQSLFLGTSIAAMLTFFLLPGYVEDAYLGYYFPFLCFIIIWAVAVMWEDVYRITTLTKIHRFAFPYIALVFAIILFSNYLIPTAMKYNLNSKPINPDFIKFMQNDGYGSFFLIAGPFRGLPNGITGAESEVVDLKNILDLNTKLEFARNKYGDDVKVFYICGPFYRDPKLCKDFEKYLPAGSEIVYKNELYFISRIDLTKAFNDKYVPGKFRQVEA